MSRVVIGAVLLRPPSARSSHSLWVVAGPSITSKGFEHGDRMPDRHALEGENLSPPLSWSGLPEGTQSLAVTCDDPDAPGGTFAHWIAWAIDPDAGALGEGEKPQKEGQNDFGHTRYDGPAPPPGHGPHRYFFRLYALDSAPALDPGASREELLDAIEGRVLATAEHMGTYER
jgi:Raf kinase inhibitor-like YbhB/YbcL family protein